MKYDMCWGQRGGWEQPPTERKRSSLVKHASLSNKQTSLKILLTQRHEMKQGTTWGVFSILHIPQYTF